MPMLVRVVVISSLLSLISTVVLAAPPPFDLAVFPGGAMQVSLGTDVWHIESAYSYPGEVIGYNRLTSRAAEGEPGWLPVVETLDTGVIRLECPASRYNLLRVIRPEQHRIRVSDTLTNTSPDDVGILVDHIFSADAGLAETRLSGAMVDSSISAENPTLFLRSDAGGLAAVAEDNAFRIQFHALKRNNGASMGLRHLGIPPGGKVVLEWTLYPLTAGTSYFDFINLLRSDWHVGATLPGPADWVDVTRPEVRALLDDRDQLRQFLNRQGLKLVLLVPWLDYEHLHRTTGELVDRNAYKVLMREAAQRIKAVDPEIKLLGCMEAPFVSLPGDVVDGILTAMPSKLEAGYHDMTDAMFEAFRSNPDAWNRWGDSIVWTRDGKAKVEYYQRGRHNLIALTVRPQLGNGQHAYLMDQARFILEEAGLDGFYVDSFTGAQHWHYGYSYDRWDGVTVDIDGKTGGITGRYTDLALAGVGARKALIEYGLDRGKLVILNGHPIDRDTQGLPAIWFNESEWVFEPLQWMSDRPPWEQRPCEAHLSSPIALGFRPSRGGDEATNAYARFIMKGAIAYLRHSVLYFHYVTAIPDAGPGSGEYGPFIHMFPITPVRLGEGFVEGRERTIACVSRACLWAGARRPRILLFDLHGRAVKHEMQAVRDRSGWLVDLKLDDWNQIAVIEAAPAQEAKP